MAELTVTSYNVHSAVGADGRCSIDRVAGVIRAGGADVVCLQEIEVNGDVPLGSTPRGAKGAPPPMKTRIWSAHHSDDQPALIASLVGYDYHAFVPAIRSRAASHWEEAHGFASDADVSGNFGDERLKNTCIPDLDKDEVRMGRFGIAILSRHPIVELRVRRYKRYKQKTLRNAMACLVRLPDNTHVWIVNTHLGCHFVGKEQRHQAKELVEFVDSLERSANASGIILCGDFNSLPRFGSMKTIRRSGFIDVWTQMKGRRIAATFPSDARVLGLPSWCTVFLRVMRLDYIFLHKSSRGIVCKAIYVQDDGCGCRVASDHLPLCGVFFVEHR